MKQHPDSLTSTHGDELEVLVIDRRSTISAAVSRLEAFEVTTHVPVRVLAGQVEVAEHSVDLVQSEPESEALARVMAVYQG